jgi:hypothetical protein
MLLSTVHSLRNLGWALIGLDIALLAYHAVVFGMACKDRNSDLILELTIAAGHFLGNLCSVLDLKAGLDRYATCLATADECEIKNVETLNSFLFSGFTTYVDMNAVARAFTFVVPLIDLNTGKHNGNAGKLAFSIQYQILTICLLASSLLSFGWSFTVYSFSEPLERRKVKDEPAQVEGSARRGQRSHHRMQNRYENLELEM